MQSQNGRLSVDSKTSSSLPVVEVIRNGFSSCIAQPPLVPSSDTQRHGTRLRHRPESYTARAERGGHRAGPFKCGPPLRQCQPDLRVRQTSTAHAQVHTSTTPIAAIDVAYTDPINLTAPILPTILLSDTTAATPPHLVGSRYVTINSVVCPLL